MTSQQPPSAGFPAWAAPGIGLVVGGFLGYVTILQNDPLSPLPPWASIAVGAGIGLTAGSIVGLREGRRKNANHGDAEHTEEE